MKLISLMLAWFSLSAAALPASNEVQEKLRKAIEEELPKVARVQVEEAHSRIAIPRNAKISVTSPHPGIGNVTFEARWKEKNYPRRVFGSARVKVFAPILVARTIVRHGDTLDSGNTAYEYRELTPVIATGYFVQEEKMPALRAHGTLRSGMIIGAGNSQPAVLIQSGQAVDLVHQAGNLRISAKVKALEGGNPNSWVRVENPSSKKIFLARIVSAGEVRLR